ncbi:MAG: DUF5060 domain-containing protein [Armatimonadota bacterium]
MSTNRLQTQVAAIGRWSLWEIAVSSERIYANPFADVTPEAVLSAPSGRKVTAFGFYDGDATWRVRFMPDEIGTWHYEVRFADGSVTTSGRFRCVASKLHGPLRVQRRNPLWFEHADGTPFYMRAFHLWNIDVLDERILNSTLDLLKRQGFNTVVGPHLHPSVPVPRLPWQRGADGRIDFSRFNLTLWQNLDRVLHALAERGMILIPFSLLGGTNEMPRIPTMRERDLFLRYWVSRWRGYWNATFQPTSEWEEGFSEQEIQYIGNRLQELDNERHLISVHSLRASTEPVQKAHWYHYHTIQDKLDNRNFMKYTWFVDLFRKVPKPVFAHECLWEGNFYQREAGMDIDNLRHAAWVIALCGGQINYADEVVAPRRWQRREDISKTFSELGTATKPLGQFYAYLKILGDFLQSLPFWRMTPQPEVANTGICLAESDREMVVYAPQGGRVRARLSEDGKATFTARWFNPREGKYIAKTAVVRAEIDIEAPDTQDWVLYIHRR